MSSATATTNQKQMIFWTGAIVFLMSVISFFVLVQPPAHLQASIPPHALSSLRQPASLTEVEGSIQANAKNQAIDVSVPCEGESTIDLPSTVSQVRLMGSACHAKNAGEFVSSEIRNEANGFSATVFYPKAKTYSTDYMTLSSGTNRIKIVHQLSKGGREAREFVVQRND